VTPGNATTPPDQDQRDLILGQLDVNMLVEAAAGTGKTTSLMGRMVALLATGRCRPASMAAVTFTRKAAAELRSRFQAALEAAARKASGDEKQRLAEAATIADRCYIGTIHSFCARLLRERPLESGAGIGFEETEDTEDKALLQEAWEEYANELLAAGNPLVDELDGVGLSIGDLESTFETLALYPDVQEWPIETIERPDFSPAIPPLMTYIEHMKKLLPSLPPDMGNDSLMPAYHYVTRISRQTDFNDPVQLAVLLESFRKTPGVVHKVWPGGKEQAKEEKARWEDFAGNHATPLTDRWYRYRYEKVLRAVAPAIDRYNALKARRNVLNFQDLLVKTAAMLRENPHVRKYYRSRITHLLVDEFQDTDPLQAEIMMLLTSEDTGERNWRKCRPVPGSLFVVGDPKQSIYRFRRADIVTYNEVKNLIRENGGTIASLSASFRTSKPIVNWVNEVFSTVFPETENRYSPGRRDLMVGRRKGSGGELSGICRITVPGELSKQACEYEANFIAAFIRRAIDERRKIPRSEREIERGVTPEAQPGDFLIVTRTKDPLSLYASSLQEMGIPHHVTGGSALNEVSELALLHSCARAAVEPYNPVAVVAALRSEAFGASDVSLYSFRKNGGEFNFHMPLPKGLDENHAAVIGGAFEKLRKYYRWLQNLPPAAAVEAIAGDLGLLVLAGSRSGGNELAGCMAKAFELVRAAQSERWSAPELVEYLGQLVAKEEKHDGVPAGAGEQSVVRLMNLHKAKGLEAPVVFLAGPKGSYNPDPWIHIDRSGDSALGYILASSDNRTIAMPPRWDELSEEEKKFEAAEADRLMYVAATRAGSMICIVQKEKYNNYNPWNSFAKHLDGAEELDHPGKHSAPTNGEIRITEEMLREMEDRISGRWKECAAATHFHAPAKKLSVTGQGPAFATGGEGALWGSVIHTLLEAAASAGHSGIERMAASVLEENGLDTAWAIEAAGVVQSVMESEIWRRAEKSTVRLVEAPFHTTLPSSMFQSGKIPEKLPEVQVSGVIDLAFREDKGWVIVDYKTDDVSGGRLEELVEHYSPQLETYARAWEKCTGEKVVETGLFFTSNGQYCNT